MASSSEAIPATPRGQSGQLTYQFGAANSRIPNTGPLDRATAGRYARPRLLIVDAQVHIWGADSPNRPWPPGRAHQAQKPYPVTKGLVGAAGRPRSVGGVG